MIKKKKNTKEIRSWGLCILAAFLISSVLKKEVVASVKVEQSSMENTLYSNERLIIDKLSYNFFEPKRGDIIIFHLGEGNDTIIDYTFGSLINIISKDNSDENSRLVKRVIGVAGDEVNIEDGYVYINDEKIDEPYVKGETISRELKFPMKVGENQLFVLGDNRNVSKDSRRFGVIDCKQVEGKAIFRVYPFDRKGSVK
jgi:signal peptidase I